MPVANSKAYSSSDLHDKVIFAGNFVVISGNSGGYATNLNQYGYPLGIYSVDNGITWRDLEGFANLAPNRGVDIVGTIKCDPIGNVTVGMTRYNGAPAGVNCLVKFVLLANDNPSSIAYPVGGSTGGAYSNRSDGGYRVITQNDTVPGFDNGSLRTVGLTDGGPPLAQHWNKGFGADQDITPFSSWIVISGGTFSSGYYVYYDSTNIYAKSGAGSFDTWYYRVYKDS